MSHTVVFLDRDSLVVDLRRPSFPHEWREYPATTPDQVAERLQGATVAISNKVVLKADLLARLPALELIAVAATGTDNVDLDYCREHGIRVVNIRNYSVHTVPEHVFSLALALRRNLLAYRGDLRQGLWQQSSQFCLFTHPVHDLHGSTLGVFGYGALGRAVAELGRAFGMTVLLAEHKGVAEPRPGYTEFTETLRTADVVTLHCPLTEQTRHMIGTAEFMLMRRHALLINTARGGLVDEEALVYALQRGVIAGAGLDVLAEEPPRDGNPLLELDLPNLMVTPHVAWSSREAMQILADQLIDNIESYVRGEPQNVVA